MYPFKFLLSVLSGRYLGVELLGHVVLLNCLRNYQILFQSSCANLHSHQQCMRIPMFPRPRNICHFPFLGIAALVRMMWYLLVVLIFVVLNVFASWFLVSCLEKGSKATCFGLCLIPLATISHLLPEPAYMHAPGPGVLPFSLFQLHF